MKFKSVAEARSFVWREILNSLERFPGHFEGRCDDEFDRRRMRKAVASVMRSLKKRIERSASSVALREGPATDDRVEEDT